MFLIFFILSLLILSGIHLFVLWGSSLIDGFPVSSEQLINSIPGSIFDKLLVAVFTALIMLFVRMQKKPGFHFLSFIVTLIIALAVFISGILFLEVISASSDISNIKSTETGLKNYLIPEKINTLRNFSLYFEEIEDNELQNILLIKSNNSLPGLRYFPIGRSLNVNNELILTVKEKDNEQIKLIPPNLFSSIFKPDYPIKLIQDSLETINKDIKIFLSSSQWEFYLLCFCLIFVIVSSRFFMRITKWLLINFSINILIIIGILFLYSLLRIDITRELVKVVGDQPIVRLFPSFVIFVLGILLSIFDLLLIPHSIAQNQTRFITGR